jgi:hypothetical protein
MGIWSVFAYVIDHEILPDLPAPDISIVIMTKNGLNITKFG